MSSAAVALAAVCLGWAPLLSERPSPALAEGLGVALIVGLGVARGVVYPALIGVLALPFVSDQEAGKAIAVLLLSCSLLLVPRLRGFDVATTDGALRFTLAVAGWLFALLAATFDVSYWWITLACGFVAGGLLVWRLRYAKRKGGTLPLLAPGTLGAVVAGVATFAAALVCGMAEMALAARVHPPIVEPPVAPPLPPAPPQLPRSIVVPPYPPHLQGVAEPDNDLMVQTDTQTWCAFTNLTRGMRHAPRLQSLRWTQLEWRYQQHEAAAACEMAHLIRQAVPERGACTNDNFYTAINECEMRENRDRKASTSLP